MAYPSTITVFTNPAPTDKLNNPSHSGVETAQNTALSEVMNAIGTDASIIGTLIGDLRNPNSGGGGHIQKPETGGTGQTSYTKGDLLVATSVSVLSKLALSSIAGNTLIVDPTQAAGVGWGPASGTRLAINLSSVLYTGGQASVESTLFATSIAAGTLGSVFGIKFKGEIKTYASNTDFLVQGYYGNGKFASANIANFTSITGLSGTVEGTLVARNAASSQLGYLTFNAANNAQGHVNGSGMWLSYGQHGQSTSVNSAATQDLVITGKFNAGDARNSILTGMFVVERIV